MEIIWLLLFVLLQVSSVLVSDAVVRDPVILVVKHGQEIHLSCPLVFTSNSTDWYHTSVGGDRVGIRNKGSTTHKELFKNSTLSGQNLTILAAQVEHAGLYECSALTGKNGDIWTAETLVAYAVVLISDPVCEVAIVNVTENQYAWLHCSISYRGNWKPNMNWTQRKPGRVSDDDVWMNVTTQENVENNITTLNSSLGILGRPLKEPLVFECSIFFRSNSCCEANKTLGYNYTWVSPEINVLYGTRNVTIEPIKDTLHPGDILICKATGNPAPEFEWRISGSNIFVSEFQFEVNASMVRQQPYVISCKAKNSISESVTNITVTVQIPMAGQNEHPKAYIIITIAFAVVSVVIFVLATTMCCVGRKQKNTASLGLLENTQQTQQSVYHYIVDPPTTASIDDSKLIGEDGTMYARMNSNAPSPTSSRHVKSTKFEPSNYASIDHTVKVPKLRSQRMNI